MALPIEVSYHHFDPTDTVRDKLDALIADLEKFESAIVSGRVVVEGTQQHGTKKVVEIAVELSLPKGHAIGKRTAEFPSPAGQQTFDRAATDAFRAAAGQIRAHLDKMRPHETKNLDHQPQRGRVEKINRTVNNGFVEMPDSPSLFFAEDVVEGDFARLEEGDEVLITRAAFEGPYGPQAASVKPVAPLERGR